jgi:pSer/pThr/pTyr-binding forkhead associated (FHA) protein
MKVTLTPAYCKESIKPVIWDAGTYLIGRGNHCAMQILVPDVSRSHCRIRVTDDRATIRDLESRNGTFINGERVLGERTLQHADVLGLGTTLLTVDIREDDCDLQPFSQPESARRGS